MDRHKRCSCGEITMSWEDILKNQGPLTNFVADLFQHRYFSPTFKVETDDLTQPLERGRYDEDPSALLRILRKILKIYLKA